MRLKLSLSVILLAFFVGCAYFNTFFNAKYYYKKAYYETRRNRSGTLSSGEQTNYDRSIQKSLKLLDMYPNSKYVDDALLLLGKAYYYKQEYRQAERKLRELEQAYPDGELALKGRLWLARTAMALEAYDEAEERFQSLLEEDLPKSERANVQFALGQFHERREEFELAIRSYDEALRLGLDEERAEALISIAIDYDTLGIYDRAAEYFQRVVDTNPSMEMLFEAELKYAVMQQKLGDYDYAIQLFQELLGEERNRQFIPRLELEIAETLRLRGDFEDALLAFHDITQNHPRTYQAAEAYYRLGRMYETFGEYDRAFEQYEKVRQENTRTVYADSADWMKRDLQRFIALRQVIEMADAGARGELSIEGEEVEEDSLTVERVYAMVDSATTDTLRKSLLFRMAGKVFADSVAREKDRELDAMTLMRQRAFGRKDADPTKMDWNAWIDEGIIAAEVDLVETLMHLRERADRLEPELADNPELKSFNVEEVDVNLFYLAELYLFRFHLADTAAAIYRRMIEEFSDSPLAPRALYNLAYLYENEYDDLDNSASLYSRLVETFPNTAYAQDARRKLGEAYPREGSEPIFNRFLEAERRLFQTNDPEAAFETYGSIWRNDPESEQAPRALYGMAWVAEKYLDSLDRAYALYDSLIQRYPESPFALEAKPKVEAVRSERTAREAESATSEADTVAIRTSAPTDSTGAVPQEAPAPSDTTRSGEGASEER